MLGGFSLQEYYRETFMLTQNGFPISEQETWLIFEREIYVNQLLQHLREKAKEN